MTAIILVNCQVVFLWCIRLGSGRGTETGMTRGKPILRSRRCSHCSTVIPGFECNSCWWVWGDVVGQCGKNEYGWIDLRWGLIIVGGFLKVAGEGLLPVVSYILFVPFVVCSFVLGTLFLFLLAAYQKRTFCEPVHHFFVINHVNFKSVKWLEQYLCTSACRGKHRLSLFWACEQQHFLAFLYAKNSHMLYD